MLRLSLLSRGNYWVGYIGLHLLRLNQLNSRGSNVRRSLWKNAAKIASVCERWQILLRGSAQF